MHPVIILATSPRSGSTLLQRLLCSSSNAVIYGETVAAEIEFSLQYQLAKEASFASCHSALNPRTRKACSEAAHPFPAALTPAEPLISRALKASSNAWIEACHLDAALHDRPIWGWKSTTTPPHLIPHLVETFPKACFVLLHRRLSDSARSALACECNLSSVKVV